MSQSVIGLPAEDRLFIIDQEPDFSGPDVAEMLPLVADGDASAGQTLQREPTWRECFADFGVLWADMSPKARWTLAVSSLASIAVVGFVTVRLGPIPSVRKAMRMLPDLANPANFHWLKSQVSRVMPSTERPAQHPTVSTRLCAGALATAMVLTDAHPIQQAPTILPGAIPAVAQHIPQGQPPFISPLGSQLR